LLYRNLWSYCSTQGGNGGFPGLPILGNPMEIQGIRWESREYNENPGNTTKIPGIQWKSREYNENPGNTIRIRGTHDTNKSNVTKISICLTQNKVYFYSVNVLKSILLKKKY
jgi:hypothetical protein